MTSNLHVQLAALALLGVACTPSYVVVPASGGSMAKANRGGLMVNAVPNAWNDEPTDLDRYMSPIWVQLVNRGKQDVRVIHADFALTNSSGFRYRAISPFPNKSSEPPATPAPAAAPAPAPKPDTSKQTSEWFFDKGDIEQEQVQFAPLGDGTGSVVLVRSGGRPGGGHMGGGRMGGGSGGGRMGGGSGGGRVGGFGHGGPHYGGGYHAYPHFYGYYGYYPGWPYYYGYGYYPSPRSYPEGPSEAVIRRALPEGVLHVGGSVSGFVYFQHAAYETTGLDLSWAAHGTSGKRIDTLHVPLAVVED